MLKLRNLFSDRDVLAALHEATDCDEVVDFARAGMFLSRLKNVEVTAEMAEYWSKQFAVRKKNGDPYLTLAIPNRNMKQRRRTRAPSMQDGLAYNQQECSADRILCFGDTHAPYAHPDALDFLHAVSMAVKPTMVVHMGDEVDHHALSFHDSDPNLDSAGKELAAARKWCAALEELFPALYLVESNHGSLAFRKAKAHGIPVEYLRTYREVLFPNGRGLGWEWRHKIRVENPWGRDIQFQHTGPGDLMNLAAHESANVVVGHEHSKFGIGYAANQIDTYWSVYCGWLGDIEQMAFAYAKEVPKKPVLGCCIIQEGVPQLIPMRTDRRNRWVGRL